MKKILSTLKIIPIIVYASLAVGTATTVAVVAKTYASGKKDIFYDDFIGTSLDQNKWLIAEKSWGGNNGGVIPQNVSVSNGTLKLEGHGNNYKGGVPGINQPTGIRTGAAIATRQYFASGSYEVVAKVAPEYGACSAMWTFEYEEYYPKDKEYEELGGKGSYYAVNHEIDIEIPGRSFKNAAPDFKYALFNTFISETKDTTNLTKLDNIQNDGKWHKYRFDWHTGDEKEKARVEYYVDGKLYNTTYTTIPTNEGRFWLGIWFPAAKDTDGDGKGDSGWAGTANFSTTVFEIDSVKITPFHEKNDTKQKETYAKDGWAVDSFPEDIEKEKYNHILNGDFNDGSNYWNLDGDAKVENKEAILSSGSKTDTISQEIKVLPKLTYTIGADIKTEGTKVTIGVRKKNGSDNISKTYTKSGHVCLTFETTSSMKEIKTYVEVLRYQEINKNVSVDNITLLSGKECNTKYIENAKDDIKDNIIEDDSNNLVLNGDFTRKEENWKISGGTTFDGKRAILKSGNNTDTLSQTIKVKKKTTYKLTADIASTGADITIGIKNYNGKYTKKNLTTNKKEKIELIFTTGKDIESITVYMEVLRYQKNKENVYVDNIRLVELNDESKEQEPIEQPQPDPSPTPVSQQPPVKNNNLVIDGTFDTQNSWTLVGGAKIENNHAVLKSGKDTDIISQIVKVKPNTKYRFKANITTTDVNVELYVSGHNGKYTTVSNIFTNSTENATLEFVTGENVEEIKVHVQVLRYQSSDNEVYIDNVILEES